MKAVLFFLIYFSVFFLSPCQSYSQIKILKIDSTLEAPFFEAPRLLFPDWVMKRRNGKYLNVRTGRKIRQSDTTKLKMPATSQVVRYDSLPERMFPDSISSLASHAHMHGDTLILQYAFEPAPQSDELLISVSSVLLARIRESPVENLESRNPTVQLTRLKLNKRSYKKGDQLKAVLEFSIEYELNEVARGPYRQRIYYKGWMMCKVD
jgi:hypothetical protein